MLTRVFTELVSDNLTLKAKLIHNTFTEFEKHLHLCSLVRIL